MKKRLTQNQFLTLDRKTLRLQRNPSYMNNKSTDALRLFFLQTTRLLNPLLTDDELSRHETMKIRHVRLLLITSKRLQIKQ